MFRYLCFLCNLNVSNTLCAVLLNLHSRFTCPAALISFLVLWALVDLKYCFRSLYSNTPLSKVFVTLYWFFFIFLIKSNVTYFAKLIKSNFKLALALEMKEGTDWLNKEIGIEFNSACRWKIFHSLPELLDNNRAYSYGIVCCWGFTRS